MIRRSGDWHPPRSVGPVERVTWVGGPLDGCVERRSGFTHYWIGPNVSGNAEDTPHVYQLMRREDNSLVYEFLPDGVPRAE